MNILGKNALDLVYWPIYGSIFLVLWTVIVSPWSRYGDGWAIFPALFVFPAALCVHIFLLFKSGWKIKMALYGMVHLMLLFVISIACFMLISKDSL